MRPRTQADHDQAHQAELPDIRPMLGRSPLGDVSMIVLPGSRGSRRQRALFFASEAPLVINPHIYSSSLGYDTLRDFAPVTGLVRTAFYVITCPNLQITTLKGLADLSRTKNLTYASTGFGTTMNLAGEMLKLGLNFDMTHVPYKGVPPAMTDIIACNVDVGFGAYNSALPLIKSGRVKGLAVSTETRMSETPDIPTLRESGFVELEQIKSSFSVLAPAKTPRPIIELLHKEIVAIMNTDEMKKELSQRGMFLMISQKPEDFTDWIKDASKRYKDIVTNAKIRVE